MTEPSDAYWDELGVAWCARDPDVNVIARRLQARLRRQSLLITAAVVAGAALSLAGLLLGLGTIWSGWTTGIWNLVTRGFAIGAIAVILAIATSSLLPVRASDADRSLSEMIDLAIARAHRALTAIRCGYYASGVAVVFGLVGTAIRIHLTRAPRMSPILDVALLAIFSLGLFFCGRHVRVNLAKWRYLKHALSLEGGNS